MSTKLTPVRAIRKHCLSCVGGSYSAVRNCEAGEDCHLHPWRMGKRPTVKELEEAGEYRKK